MRWLTYSIGLLLVFLVAIWWRSQPNSAETGVIASESSDQSTTDISAQATRKAEAAEHQPSQNLGEEAGLLQKPELTPAQIVQDPTQDASQKIENPAQAQPQPQGQAQPQKAENTAPATSSSKDKTPAAQAPAAAASAPVPKGDPKAADDDSDDDSDDDDSDDDDSSNVQGFNMIKHLKLLKPRVIVGQREQEERALLLELEKVFGRG